MKLFRNVCFIAIPVCLLLTILFNVANTDYYFSSSKLIPFIRAIVPPIDSFNELTESWTNVIQVGVPFLPRELIYGVVYAIIVLLIYPIALLQNLVTTIFEGFWISSKPSLPSTPFDDISVPSIDIPSISI